MIFSVADCNVPVDEPCTAIVFVWNNLCRGEPHFTLSQVAVNGTIMVVAFAPLVGLLLEI
jgi:arsenite transporter